MDFPTYATELDRRIHSAVPPPDAVIGVVWVNESAVIWSGPRGFVEAQPLGETLVTFALHEADAPEATLRFGEEIAEGGLDALAARIVGLLGATSDDRSRAGGRLPLTTG